MKYETNIKKPLRGLSGMYFREKDPETGTWENVCFEDLSEKKQREILEHKSPEWAISVAIALAKSLRKVGDQCDLSRE